MNLKKEILDIMIKPHPLQNDEYINEENKLIYCAKCRTPKQCIVHQNGQTIKPTIRCQCQREVDEKAEADF